MNTQSMNLCGYKIFSSVEVFLITRVINGDWEIISNLIDINTSDIEVTVVEFEYGKTKN
ncbi:hypothetical protein LAh8_139 [Aeromonas phage LAh_8]|uniref:Uncharacterized protein n=1 Tax=Aeromonas phage LAh_8 TaxID=2591032 RepID=A0A514A0N8_9CAUD|nr:hypothetical protein HWC31_gp140 [Aeromonas phage LAh_8]QDH46844.1 hypothetical protein LAh8_139 [Aeromonas phage LAh_8]